MTALNTGYFTACWHFGMGSLHVWGCDTMSQASPVLAQSIGHINLTLPVLFAFLSKQSG